MTIEEIEKEWEEWSRSETWANKYACKLISVAKAAKANRDEGLTITAELSDALEELEKE